MWMLRRWVINRETNLSEVKLFSVKLRNDFLSPYTLLKLCVCAHSVVCRSLQPHGLYVACQEPLSKKFSKEEYWSGLSFPIPGDLPHRGMPPLLHLLHWQADSLPLAPLGKPQQQICMQVLENIWKESKELMLLQQCFHSSLLIYLSRNKVTLSMDMWTNWEKKYHPFKDEIYFQITNSILLFISDIYESLLHICCTDVVWCSMF